MKKLTTFIAIILGLTFSIHAQPMGKKLNTEQKIKIAEEQYANGDYYTALAWYEKALAADEEDTKGGDDIAVLHKIAELHYLLRDMKNAQKFYGKLVKKDKAGAYPMAKLIYGRVLKMNGELDDAETQLQQFIQDADDGNAKTLAQAELDGIALARNMAIEEDITVENAGDNINSPYTDFAPLYVSENEMYYGAMVSNEVVVLDGNEKDYFAKIYKSTKNGDSWEKGEVLDDVVNRPNTHTGNATISADGNRLYFTRADLSSNMMTSSNIYVCERDGNGWGAAQKVEGLGGSYIVKHPAVGEMFGEEVLFFTSNMDGGKGGWDIYYSKINGDSYGAPVNLGDKINTVGDDVTPFYRDGVLYFSSVGHPGIGGLDAFASEWDGSWSTPKNLGKNINSTYDDIYFSLNGDGYQGFVVSNRPNKRSLKSKTCCDDIYTVSIKEVVVDLEALTFDAESGDPLNGAKIQLIEMTDGSEGNTETDSKDDSHEYTFDLTRNVSYKLIASRKGYENAILEFNTADITESQTITKKMKLVPVVEFVDVTVYDTIRSQTPIILDNILYDFDKSNIRNTEESDLNQIYTYMTSYPDMIIELSSHTDSRGKDSYNQQLSQRRAESAKKWLVSKGISGDRIKAVGYGETQPIAANKNADGSDNPEGRQLNRRTEFKIIGGTKYIITSRVEKRVIKKKVGE